MEVAFYQYQWTPTYQWVPALYFFDRGQGQMLPFISKVGIHWYFWFAVKTADNKDELLKYSFWKQM